MGLVAFEKFRRSGPSLRLRRKRHPIACQVYLDGDDDGGSGGGSGGSDGGGASDGDGAGDAVPTRP